MLLCSSSVIMISVLTFCAVSILQLDYSRSLFGELEDLAAGLAATKSI